MVDRPRQSSNSSTAAMVRGEFGDQYYKDHPWIPDNRPRINLGRNTPFVSSNPNTGAEVPSLPARPDPRSNLSATTPVIILSNDEFHKAFRHGNHPHDRQYYTDMKASAKAKIAQAEREKEFNQRMLAFANSRLAGH